MNLKMLRKGDRFQFVGDFEKKVVTEIDEKGVIWYKAESSNDTIQIGITVSYQGRAVVKLNEGEKFE